MKMKYESPLMFAETFVANQYIAACKDPIYSVDPTPVRCISPGHNNTQFNTMFLDSQSACIVKFNPGVGQGVGDKFYTKFEACAYRNGCNRQNWLERHPSDTNFRQHAIDHGTYGKNDKTGFIMHDTVVDLSIAEKYQLS